MPRKKISKKYQVKHFNATVLLWLVFVIIFELCIIMGIRNYQKSKPIPYIFPVVTSFSQCEASGYPVMESYPRRCSVPGGRTYTEELKTYNRYIGATVNDINIVLPTFNAVAGKEFSIIGEVQSSWLDAGVPSFAVYDKDDRLLSKGVLSIGQRIGTSEFSVFEAAIKISEIYTGSATIHIKKATVAGTSTASARVEVDVTIE